MTLQTMTCCSRSTQSAVDHPVNPTTDIQLKANKEERIMSHLARAKQRDNANPMLFLFLMQAMAEAPPPQKRNGGKEIVTPQFRHFEKTECSALLGQAWKMKGKMFELHCLLCVDDRSFIFTSRRDRMRAVGVACEDLHSFFMNRE